MGIWTLDVFIKDTKDEFGSAFSNYACKDRIWVPSPKDGWTQAQKTQNNEFVESGLENWAKMSWTTNKVGSNDKKMKIDKFKLKKIVLDTIRRD